MSKKNFDFIAREVQESLGLCVKIRPTPSSVGEWRNEFIGLIGDVIRTFNPIITTTELKFSYQVFQDDFELNEANLGDEYAGKDFQHVRVHSEEGITETDIRDRFDQLQKRATGLPVPIRASGVDGTTSVFLNQGWQPMETGSDSYKSIDDYMVIDESPDGPPIFVYIGHSSNSLIHDPIESYYESPQNECKTVYRIKVDVQSDIWIRDETGDEDVDAICRINRAHLAEAFDELIDSHDVLETYFLPSGFPGVHEHMRATLDYNSPPAEELIRDYRQGWVSDHLRAQARAYETEDGTRGIDFGLVTQQITIEELKKRIETYLMADSSTDPIDEIRVRVEDGTELCGRLSEGSVDWDQVI